MFERRSASPTAILLALALGSCARAAAAGSGADGGARAGDGGAPPVPVVSAKVQKQDVDIYLDGLGSVAAFYTVTVKPRVDGEILKVAFREGQDVKKGDLLAQIDPRPYQVALEAAEAALLRDQPQLEEDQRNLKRYQELFAQKLIPEQQVQDQAALVGQMAGNVANDKSQIDSAKLNLVYARITSPIDGRTGLRQVDPGNVVHATDTTGLVIITQLDPIAVFFTLPQDDLGQIERQMETHTLTAQAFSRDGQASLGFGEVTLIDNQINQTTGTLKLKAVFPNPHLHLWPNQFVKVKLLVEVRKDSLTVPVAAIQRGPQGSFVYAIKADQTVEVRKVATGPTEGDVQVIERGLAAGDPIVVDGQYKLHPGSKVVAREGTVPTANGAGQAIGLGGSDRGSGSDGGAELGAGEGAGPSR